MKDIKNRKGKYIRSGKRNHMPIWAVVICDILLAGVILLTFAFFHHVLPAMQSGQFEPVAWVSEKLNLQKTAKETVPPQTDVQTEAPTENAEARETESPTTPPQTETPATEAPVDDRTEWQIKFEEKFTEEVVVTDNSYTSPEVSITIDTVTVGEGNGQIVYHVADVYVASLDNFFTYTANNEMVYFGTQEINSMIRDANAILAVSGDFLTYQKSGFLMRNGEIYAETSNGGNICVLYEDGTMETFLSRTYQLEELKARKPVQVWSFGPPLLEPDGTACTSFSASSTVKQRNPRSAVGYYEPGHYCFIVVDGRQKGYSAGMTLNELAKVFEELGCTCAYNLDGGGSAVMLFNGSSYSQQSNGGRDLGDILVISEAGYIMPEKEETQ